MEKKKITRKVITKAQSLKIEDETKEQVKEEAAAEIKQEKRKKCLFCQSKKAPGYSDMVTLKRFISDRSKILPKSRSGVCSKHQRAVSVNIKYARHLSLLPFVPGV